VPGCTSGHLRRSYGGAWEHCKCFRLDGIGLHVPGLTILRGDLMKRFTFFGIRRMLLLSAVLCLLGGVRAPLPASAQVEPLPRAHAHNDYKHERPLVDALNHGFCSVEVDIHFVDGALLVAHDREDVVPGRTLESLYLNPLRRRIREKGSVYPGDPPLTLLIDVKSAAAPTYRALRDVLRRYADMLTIFAGAHRDGGPVTAIISGNRARALMEEESIRYAAFDGRLDDLVQRPSPSPNFVPLVSSHWGTISSWQGEGPMPQQDREALRETVARAHEQGRRIRFWATADRPAVWEELHAAGVDLLNADDLDQLQQFLLEHQ